MRLDVGDLAFDAVAFGDPDGELVLLLHGFPQRPHLLAARRPELVEAGFRVVAPDQRGYSPGARPAGAGAYAMPALAADVLGMLDALGTDRATSSATTGARRWPGRSRPATPTGCAP